MNIFPNYVSSLSVESDFLVFCVARIISGIPVLVSGEVWLFLGGNLRLVVTAK